MNGIIFNIQPFSIYDGPGLRTVVFMKGCPLKCFWCHNPESQSVNPELMFYSHKCAGCGICADICPNKIKADDHTIKPAIFTSDCINCFTCSSECYNEAIEISGRYTDSCDTAETILKDIEIFKSSGGGVTFSGGEPLMQSDFVLDIMRICKEAGINTAVETSLFSGWDSIEKIIPYCDLWICDVKSMDAEKHTKATGSGNALILGNLKKLSAQKCDIIVRTPVIPGFNDCEKDIKEISIFLRSLDGPVKYELLPFHNICGEKYTALNRRYEAQNLFEPDGDTLKRLYKVSSAGVYAGGVF